MNKGTRCLEIEGVYDSIVQVLALLFLGISSSSSILIPRLLMFLDALVSLKLILFIVFINVLDDGTECTFKNFTDST